MKIFGREVFSGKLPKAKLPEGFGTEPVKVKPRDKSHKRPDKLTSNWKKKWERVDQEGDSSTWVKVARRMTSCLPRGWQKRPLREQESLWKNRDKKHK